MNLEHVYELMPDHLEKMADFNRSKVEKECTHTSMFYVFFSDVFTLISEGQNRCVSVCVWAFVYMYVFNPACVWLHMCVGEHVCMYCTVCVLGPDEDLPSVPTEDEVCDISDGLYTRLKVRTMSSLL